MAKPTISQKDVVILQRNLNNTVWEEIHISGSDLIFYNNASGDLTADKISSFMASWLSTLTSVDSSSWSSQSLSTFYASASKSSSWASSSYTSSFLLPGTYFVTASWSDTSSYAQSASWLALSSTSNSSSWASQSLSSRSKFLRGDIHSLPLLAQRRCILESATVQRESTAHMHIRIRPCMHCSWCKFCVLERIAETDRPENLDEMTCTIKIPALSVHRC